MRRWGLVCLALLAAGVITATVALAATSLTADPTSLDFTQDVDDGTTAAQSTTITNTNTNPVTIESVTTDNGAFAVDPQLGDCDAGVPTVLLPNDTCTVHVTFTPPGTGDQSGTLTVQSSGDDASVGLTGTGTQTAWSADQSSLDLGSQNIGDGASMPDHVTVTNTGTEPITFSGIDIAGTDAADFYQQAGGNECSAGPLGAGASCEVTIVFDPTSVTPSPDKSATLTISSSTAGVPDLSVDLSGHATQRLLTRTPATVNFTQDINHGPSAADFSTITNSGDDPVVISSVVKSGDPDGNFELLTGQTGDCAAGTLGVGDSCKVRARFDPSTTDDNPKTATVTVNSNAPAITVDLSGTATLHHLTPDRSSVDFATQDVNGGPTSPETSVVTNDGTVPVSVSGATLGGANPHQFELLTGLSTDCSSGGSLAVSEHCDVRVRYDPTSRGAKAATVTVASNAPPVVITLTGSGTQAVYRQSDVPIAGGYVANGQVNAVGFDSAGRAYLGGTFTSIGPRTGHGVKLSTTSDQPAPSFPDVDGTIRAVAPDGSGGWFIGGDFSTVGAVPRSRLAHIDSSGGVDPNWNPGADGRVNAITLTGTAVYVGGEFGTVGGQPRPFMARVSKATGDVTTSWNASVNGRVTALATGSDGIYVGGDFTQIAGLSRNRLARIHDLTFADADEFWDPDADGNVAAIAVSASSVYVGGSFTHIGGTPRDRLAKLDLTTGGPDLGWHPGATGGAVSALALSGSDLYAGGAFTSVDSQPRNRIAKIDASTGAVALGWNPNANNTVLALAVTATDVYAAGDFTQIGVATRNRIAKLAASDGSLDAWNPNANAIARSIAVNGTDVFAGGDFTSVGGQTRNRLARVDPDGSVDDWNPDAGGSVSALVVSGSDVYVGGAFTTVGGQPRARVAKLSTSTGAPDATWDPGASGTVSALAVSGTDVYAGGLFTTIGGQPRERIAKLIGTSGTAAPGWNPGATSTPPGGGAQVSALAVSGSDVYAGGSFTTIDGQPRNRIARLSATSGAADSWDPNANSSVSALAVSGSTIYAGGSFSSIGGQPRNFAAKLSTTSPGNADPTWNPGANSVVRAIALTSSDAFIGGDFTAVSGQSHGRLAKLPQAGDGAADAGWDPGANNTVLALAAQGDRLVAGGSFTAVGGQSSAGFALLELPALSPSPGGLAFGNHEVSAGASSEHTSTVTNNGSQTVHITAVTLGGPDAGQFSHPSTPGTDCVAGTDLAPGGHCEVRASFDPSSPGAKSAEITIDSDSPGVSVALSGVGTQSALSPAPTSLDFGSQARDAGATTVHESTVTNTGTQTITLSQVTVGGTNAGDFTRQRDEPLDCRGSEDLPDFTATQLLPGQSCKVRVTFNPSDIDGRSATVTVTPTVGDPVDIALTGTGTLTQIARAPASINFMKQDIDGTSAEQTSVVSNTGTEPVTISGVSIPGSDFEQLTDHTTDCKAGKSLPRSGSCDVRVVFHPGAVGAKSGTATISSSTAGVGNLTVGLAGEGTQTELTPASATLTYGSRELAAPASTTQTATFTNTGTEQVTINNAVLSGHTADFVHLTDQTTDCKNGKQIPASGTCEVRLQFDPANRGLREATVTVSSNAANVVVNASGTGIETRLSATPSSHDFANQDIDVTPATYFESTVTNAGDQTVNITGVTSSDQTQFPVVDDGPGTNCTTVTHLDPGNTCKVRIKFDPTTTGHKSATITVASNAPSITIDVTGDGTQTELSTDHTSLDFGNQFTGGGATAEKVAQITNTGTETVNFTAVTMDGDSSQFPRDSSAATDCKSTTSLAPGGHCDVRVTFDPDTTGDKASTVHIASNAAEVTVALTGHGTLAQLGRSDATLAFGDRDIDDPASAPKTSTITNTGNVDVTITSVSFDAGGTDPGAFAHPTGDPGDCVDNRVLHPTDTCTVRATFHPTTVGDKSASLTVHSNAADVTVALTGRGTQTAWSLDSASLVIGKQDIDDGASAAQEATVTNDGTEPITITGVTSDDSQFQVQSGQGTDCTSSSPLAHGATCKVRVKFDPSSVGLKSGTVTVATSTGGVSNLTFGVGGEGTQTAWSRSPASLAFGKQDIDDNATLAQDVTVTNGGTEAIAISSVTSDDAQFQLDTGPGTDCSEISSLAGGASCKVRVKFDPSSVGLKSGTVTVATSTGGVSNLTFGVGGEGTQTAWSRSPASLAFGKQDIDDNATLAQDVTVTNGGTEPIAISGVTSDDAQFQVQSGQGTDCTSSSPLAAGATCKVRVKFDPSSVGLKSGTVTVATTTGIPNLTLGVGGEGTQTQLSASPASVAFGGRGVGQDSPTKTTTITNTGTEGVAFTSFEFAPGPDVSQFDRLIGQSGDCTASTPLPAGGTCDLRLRFSPTSEGAKSASLLVKSGAPEMQIPLTGTGLATDLTAAPGTLAFAAKDVDDGPTAVQETTVTNTGAGNVTVAGVAVTGDFARAPVASGDCAGGTLLPPNGTCKLRVTFDPSATGPRTGTVTVSSDSADVTVALTGSGIQTELTRGAPSISAGSQDVDDGPTTPEGVAFTNTGTEDVTISSVDVTGEFGQATVGSGDCTSGTLLHSGDVCNLRTQFDPSSVGSKTGSVNLHSNAGDFTVALDGAGIQTSLSHDPTAIDFGVRDVGAGATAVKESTVTNTGTQPVTISAISLVDPGTARFLRVSGLSTDCAIGATLNAGNTCKLRAMFVPQTAGAKSATMTLTSSGGVATLALTGTGRPRLTLSKLSAKASSTKKRRLTVNVTPLGGTVRNIVVQVKSRSGKVLGTGNAANASRRKSIIVKLKAPLKAGAYRLTARGRDALGNAVTASPKDLKLR